MTLEERGLYIDECIKMDAELNGVPVHWIGRWRYAELSDEELEKEYDWLYEMVYLK